MRGSLVACGCCCQWGCGSVRGSVLHPESPTRSQVASPRQLLRFVDSTKLGCEFLTRISPPNTAPDWHLRRHSQPTRPSKQRSTPAVSYRRWRRATSARFLVSLFRFTFALGPTFCFLLRHRLPLVSASSATATLALRTSDISCRLHWAPSTGLISCVGIAAVDKRN